MINLITGGAGFIGSFLCERLLSMGCEVLVVDDLSTGSFENIQHLKSNKNFRFFFGSVEDENLMEPLVQQCDIIYHLAAAVGVRKIIENPVNTLETNIIGTHKVLELASKYHKKIVVTSTSEVYGKFRDAPFKEDDDCLLGPTSKNRWSYACSKMIDEYLALASHKERGLPVVIARLFNTVGPRQSERYGMVIPNFIKQALAGRPITVFGDGQQSRCFVHVSEIVEALIKIAANENAVGQVINLGSNQEITIEDLAVKVKRLALSASDIVYVPYDEAYESGFEDMERRVPDITKAKRLIGFNPVKDVDFIINNIIESESKNNYIRDHKTVISTVPLWHNRTNESICE